MSKSILLTFDNEEIRSHFISFMEQQAKKSTDIGRICKAVLPKIIKDPQVRSAQDKFVSLWVSGKKLAEGSYSEISKKFNAEISAHSANVQIKENVDGSWVVLRKRLA